MYVEMVPAHGTTLKWQLEWVFGDLSCRMALRRGESGGTCVRSAWRRESGSATVGPEESCGAPEWEGRAARNEERQMTMRVSRLMCGVVALAGLGVGAAEAQLIELPGVSRVEFANDNALNEMLAANDPQMDTMTHGVAISNFEAEYQVVEFRMFGRSVNELSMVIDTPAPSVTFGDDGTGSGRSGFDWEITEEDSVIRFVFSGTPFMPGEQLHFRFSYLGDAENPTEFQVTLLEDAAPTPGVLGAFGVLGIGAVRRRRR